MGARASALAGEGAKRGGMGDTNTKQAIVDAFVQKVSDDSLRAVHVAKLIKELGINRNTFYYHFDSKFDVALYVFRVDLAKQLRAAFAEDELVSASVDPKRKLESIPYYVHCEVGAHTLDLGGFYKSLVRCVLERPAFYRSLFDFALLEFRLCFEGLYRPAVIEDLKFVLGGRYLPQGVFDFFADYYTRYLFQLPEYFLRHSSSVEEMFDDKVNPYWNIPYETLTQALQAHVVYRPR